MVKNKTFSTFSYVLKVFLFIKIWTGPERKTQGVFAFETQNGF